MDSSCENRTAFRFQSRVLVMGVPDEKDPGLVMDLVTIVIPVT
jgi:hypothetical protein